MGMSIGGNGCHVRAEKSKSLISLNDSQILLWLLSLSLCVIWERQDICPWRRIRVSYNFQWLIFVVLASFSLVINIVLTKLISEISEHRGSALESDVEKNTSSQTIRQVRQTLDRQTHTIFHAWSVYCQYFRCAHFWFYLQIKQFR